MDSSSDSTALARFERYLIDAGFTRKVIAQHVDHSEGFLRYLRRVGVAPEIATPTHVSGHLRAGLNSYRRKSRCSSRNQAIWLQRQAASVQRFLVFVQGRWPPESTSAKEPDRTINAVLSEYEHALQQQRALSRATIVQRIDEARRFLSQLPGPDVGAALTGISIASVDRYIKSRAHGMARSTCRGLCINLRSMLRVLHTTGRIPRDLAPGVITPSAYKYEGLPSTITAEQIRSILEAAHKDRSPSGIRNYAILLLLATYGLRAREVCKLRLDDIDWRESRLWVQHAKTGARNCLPLLPRVGKAMLDYLRKGRPACKDREVFIRMTAPRSAFFTATAIYSLLRRHLARVGIRLNGKRGPHVFRHARAASLLKAGVPLKTVGDVLGHRSACATAVYLKLDDHRLRDVALSLPLPGITP